MPRPDDASPASDPTAGPPGSGAPTDRSAGERSALEAHERADHEATTDDGPAPATARQASDGEAPGGPDGPAEPGTSGPDEPAEPRVRPARWYHLQGRQQHGPLGLETMRRLVLLGTVGPETYVWADGMPQWRPAREVPALVPPPAHRASGSGWV